MSKTLNLIDVLLNSGRHFHEIGRTAEAIDILTRLAGFRKLPLSVLEQIQSLLADLYMERGNYAKARRHLTALLASYPLKGEYYFKMATAIERDDDADWARAEKYYAQAAKLESDNAAYWAEYGCYLLWIGNRKLGLKALRKAYALGVHDPEIVGQVAEALREQGRFEEAATKVRGALFLNKDQRFGRLWQEHQFHTISQQQERRQHATPGRRKGAVILPFAAAEPTGKYAELGPRTIRIDQAEEARGPKSAIRLRTMNDDR